MTTQYYQRTLKILLDDYACGLVTATGLIVEYIRIKFAPGEEIILEPKQVIAELGISKSQFYRGITKIKKFQKLTVSLRDRVSGFGCRVSWAILTNTPNPTP